MRLFLWSCLWLLCIFSRGFQEVHGTQETQSWLEDAFGNRGMERGLLQVLAGWDCLLLAPDISVPSSFLSSAPFSFFFFSDSFSFLSSAPLLFLFLYSSQFSQMCACICLHIHIYVTYIYTHPPHPRRYLPRWPRRRNRGTSSSRAASCSCRSLALTASISTGNTRHYEAGNLKTR